MLVTGASCNTYVICFFRSRQLLWILNNESADLESDAIAHDHPKSSTVHSWMKAPLIVSSEAYHQDFPSRVNPC